MEKFILRSGLELEDVDKLSVIHISGTKGKGSTAAFSESILRHQGYKTGFFSSPHLVEVRERFRINGKPIAKELFSSKFWHVYNKLNESKVDYDGLMPPYFAFLTVLSCHIFLEEKVDVTILEVGIGGEYDSTNFIRHPVVCGITSLGLDHTSILGNTIESIAWNKAGIFKTGVPAVTVEQSPEAMMVIQERSVEKKNPVYVTLPLPDHEKITLGIHGCKQRLNAGLALQLCKIWKNSIAKKDIDMNTNCIASEVLSKSNICGIPVLNIDRLTDEEKQGLSECKWYGRNQIVHKPGITYYLDGAHTKDSMQQCVSWFNELSQAEAENISGQVVKVLLFNVTGDRDVVPLLTMLQPINFDAAVFTPNLTFTSVDQMHADNVNRTVSDASKQRRCCLNKETWDKLFQKQTECKTSMLDCVLNKDLSVNEDNNNDVLSRNAHKNSVISLTAKDKPLVSYSFPCISSALFWATQGLDSSASIESESEIPDIPKTFRHKAHIQILITGSLHLVGGTLELIMPNLND
ncbi:folylpolyglutamate synthase, mitochondrial-like isoform X2 [Patella vulgata]|nr:folylpolyglutamate synthase, mitochondrial-like isoform X2 [Patella vulgata]